jgi:hypothetical protein
MKIELERVPELRAELHKVGIKTDHLTDEQVVEQVETFIAGAARAGRALAEALERAAAGLVKALGPLIEELQRAEERTRTNWAACGTATIDGETVPCEIEVVR